MNVWKISLVAASVLTGLSVSATPAGATPAASSTLSPAQDALNALISQPNSPLPAGTRLLSVKVVDGLATADFAREMRDNFSGGDSGETRAVNGILRTLGRFGTVDRAQILVEGKPIDSLGGLLELSGPLPVIRPAAAPAARRFFHRTAR